MVCPIKTDERPEEGNFVKSLDDLKPDTLYCIIAKHSSNVLELKKSKELFQTESKDCEDGSLFEFVESKLDGKEFVTRIMDKETYNFLGVFAPKEDIQVVQGQDRNGKSNWQKWKIIETDQKDKDKTWLSILNLESDYNLDVAWASQKKAKIITYYKNTGNGNQMFALKVMKRIE